MSMQLGGSGDIKADINVTPLVDVMLVLLIIMMLVAPMLQQGVSVKLPTATNTVDKPEVQGQTVVAIERVYTYNKARKQSRLYAPQVAKHLKDGRLKEAIALSGSKDFRYSHLAKVVMAGLQEYQFQQESGGGAALNREDVLDTVRRSIQRASALTASDLKKGVSALATIGSTAPFVGLLGTVVGVINAFTGIATVGGAGIGAVSAGISEALVETALGLFVAIPAVWFYNYLTSRLEYFNVEMDNSSSELVDYFIKKTAA